MFSVLEQIARDVWAYHYRIPRRAYWGLCAVGLLVTPVAPPYLALFVLGLGAQGIVRWQVVRMRCSSCLVVPLFQDGGGAEGHAVETQTLIVDHLRRHLPERLRFLVQSLPCVVSSAEDELAAALQRRLNAAFVLHGRTAAREDGGWSVYPRVLEPANRGGTHFDPFTLDRTPTNPSFGPFVTSLPATISVRDEEFPLEFGGDLEALVHGIAGMAMEAFAQHEEAEHHLDVALARAGASENHQIDALRVARAIAITEQGRPEEAIDSLRERLARPHPSPHLLRGLAYLLGRQRWANEAAAAADRAEAADALRLALEDETDPQRDMTIYNLSQVVDSNTAEHHELVDQLLAPGSSYRRLWYVKLLEGARHWTSTNEARLADDLEGMVRHAQLAAKWYGSTLRARPRIRVTVLGLRWPPLAFKMIHRSPILYANTKDAHSAALHKWRTRYFEFRFQQIRARHVRLGDRYLRRGEWEAAFAYFDWAARVGRHDGIEHRALAFAACCRWKAGDVEDGLRRWNKAAEHSPECLLGRAMLVRQLEELELDRAVPGDEPTGIEETLLEIERRYPGSGWNDEGEFFTAEELSSPRELHDRN